MPLLGVNIDHVASIRQLRRGTFPDPVQAAAVCERAGADSIVAHLREDRRHINDADVARLKKSVRGKFNLEMSVSRDIVSVARRVRPHQATLVPERRRELTTEGGLDVIGHRRRVAQALAGLESAGIAVSIFIDPDLRQIDCAARMGCRHIELHTGAFANARSATKRRAALKQLALAARYAAQAGFSVYAGHGLDYENIKPVRAIGEIEEYNIGYAIICRAVFAGLEQAVRQMKQATSR